MSEFIDLDAAAPAPGGGLRSSPPPPVFKRINNTRVSRRIPKTPPGGLLRWLVLAEIWYLHKIVFRMDNRSFYTNAHVDVSCGFVLPVDVQFNIRGSLFVAAAEQEYFFEHILRNEKDSKLEAEASPFLQPVRSTRPFIHIQMDSTDFSNELDSITGHGCIYPHPGSFHEVHN